MIDIKESMTSTAENTCSLIRAREELEEKVRHRTAELENANRIIREKQSQLDLALDVSEVAITCWNLANFSLEWEHRLKFLYGFRDDEELTLERLIERIHPDDREGALERIQAAIDSPSSEEWTYEFRILHPSRGLRWIHRRARIERDAAGKPLRAIGVCIDITERKEAERRLILWNQSLEQHVSERTAKLMESQARLTELRTELRHAQRLGDFSEVSAGILHQIGQPLSAIEMGFDAALRRIRDQLDPSHDAMPFFTDIQSQLGRIREIIGHLRTLAKTSQPAFLSVPINHLIADVAEVMESDFRKHGISLVLELAENLPTVHGNAVQLSQVFANLIQNSIESCGTAPSQGHHVRIRSEAIRESTGEPSAVRVTVTDSGPGIPRAILDDLFAPFLSTKPEGLGIGLRLSKTIIRCHRGAITGKNLQDGGGARFEVTLPIGARTDRPEI